MLNWITENQHLIIKIVVACLLGFNMWLANWNRRRNEMFKKLTLVAETEVKRNRDLTESFESLLMVSKIGKEERNGISLISEESVPFLTGEVLYNFGRSVTVSDLKERRERLSRIVDGEGEAWNT